MNPRVSSTTSPASKLDALLKKLPAGSLPELVDASDPVAVLIFSFLLWESTTTEAVNAYQKLQDAVVDENDLRVSLPYEIAEQTEQTDSRALERCQRLRASLSEIYRREHAVVLDSVRELGKRDCRKYFDDLEGMSPFVAARVSLFCFDVHGMPVDDHLRSLLVEVEIIDQSTELAEVGPWLARQIKAADAIEAHLKLQAWSDAEVQRRKKSKTKKTKKTKKKSRNKSSRKLSTTNKTKAPTSRRAKKA